MAKKVLAVDFGASSGRVMLGSFDGKKIELEEVHRFANEPVFLHDTMYWDFLRLFHEVKQGILKAKRTGKIQSISVDTWGVDFGLLDGDGRLMESPIHYRDARTQGMLEKSFEKIEKERFYQITGNQFMEINTAFQLLALKEKRPEFLRRADALLLMPDLFLYFLSGEKRSECSIASTTQLFDMKQRTWSSEVIQKLGIPQHLFQKVIPSAVKVGTLQKSICRELGAEQMDVIAVAGHDTQCALAAVPSVEKEFLFLSCGTWSLIGTELDAPVMNEAAQRYNVTNEAAYKNKISFLKNIIGLWLVQESRRQWMREGQEYSFSELEQLAADAEAFSCLIDPNAPEFAPAGDIPGRIRIYAEKTGQKVPETVGAVVRCINESLALQYRTAKEEIEACTGKTYTKIHMVGGGTQSRMLCQMTADACGCPVAAGPVEATVLGNVILQFIASGDIRDLKEARTILANTENVEWYLPREQEKEMWNALCQKVKWETEKIR